MKMFNKNQMLCLYCGEVVYKILSIEFKVDRPQTTVVAKNLSVL